MSRLITLPDGRQVTGCKNYVLTPKPGLVIDQRIEVQLGLDADALQDDVPLSLYIRGVTSNTTTPLLVWVSATDMPVGVEVTPAQFRSGFRLDVHKSSSKGSTVVFRCDSGGYTLWHFAAMLSNEMDESRITTVYPDGSSVFNQYYPG